MVGMHLVVWARSWVSCIMLVGVVPFRWTCNHRTISFRIFSYLSDCSHIFGAKKHEFCLAK